MEKTHTLAEVAAILRVSHRHVRRLVASGELGAFNVGTATTPRWRVTDAALRRLVSKRRHRRAA
jgi:excisionase family DNA binding protein